MSTGILAFVKDYGGIAVGVILLLLAVSVLPGRVKWYVLTGGLAVLGYEAYMRTVNRRMLREADAERERLRGEMAQLDSRRKELEETVNTLNTRLVELNSRMAGLNQQREVLKGEGDLLSERKKQLDDETEQVVAESKALIQQAGNNESILAKLKEANDAIDQMDKLAR